MSDNFVCGSSPIYEYPPDVPSMHPVGTCNPAVCPICTAQRIAVETGRAKIIGTCTWSGTETHSTLRRSLWDCLLGRPGKWMRN